VGNTILYNLIGYTGMSQAAKDVVEGTFLEKTWQRNQEYTTGNQTAHQGNVNVRRYQSTW
jgi:hypothetical protein